MHSFARALRVSLSLAFCAPLAFGQGTANSKINAFSQIQPNQHFQGITATQVEQTLKLVSKLPRVDATHPDFSAAAGCANPADPSGANDSTCAINAALAFSRTTATATTAIAGNNVQPNVVYFPPGTYKVSSQITMHNGEFLIADAKDSVELRQTDPRATLIAFVAGGVSGDAYVSYGGLVNINLRGSGHTSSGHLLEVDTPYFIGVDVNGFNTAGRAYQFNAGEREWLKGTFYNTRQGVVLGGDQNESHFNIQAVGPGETVEHASNNPPYSWCLTENCNPATGVFPAANGGASGGPTPLIIPGHGAFVIEKAVNVIIDGDDNKDNQLEASFKIVGGSDIIIHSYTEAAYQGTWPAMAPSLVLGGSAESTTLTSTITSATNGGYTYYDATVASADWMPIVFGSQQNFLTTNLHNSDPMIIRPADYTPGSTTASATCTGINQGQFEVIGDTQFYRAGTVDHVTLQSRNSTYRGNTGVYNSSTNPTGVPANYNWGSQCSTPPVVEDIGGATNSAAVEISNYHANSIQGGTYTAGTGVAGGGFVYPAVQGGCQNQPGEFILGVPCDADPHGFFTKYADPNDPSPSTIVQLKMSGNNQMFNSGSNPFEGQITVVRQAQITTTAGTIGKDSNTFEPNATVPMADGSAQINFGSSFYGGGHIVAVGDGEATPKPVNLEFSAPAVGETWLPSTGLFTRFTSYYDPGQQASSYSIGTAFANDFQIFPQLITGQTKPNSRLHLAGGPTKTDSFEWDYGRGTGSWQQEIFVDQYGVHFPDGWEENIVAYSTSSAHTITPAETESRFAPPSGGLTLTLPTCNSSYQGAQHGLIFDATGNPVTIVSASQFNINQVAYTTIPTTIGIKGKWQCDGAQWHNVTTVPDPATVTATAGAGLGGTTTAAVTAGVISRGSLTASSTAAGTASSALVNVAFSVTLSKAPLACFLTPQNAATAALGVGTNVFPSVPTTTGFTINAGATPVPAGNYALGWSCP